VCGRSGGDGGRGRRLGPAAGDETVDGPGRNQ
jgi:hypothetical protein